jgi:hypothetical protein
VLRELRKTFRDVHRVDQVPHPCDEVCNFEQFKIEQSVGHLLLTTCGV